MGLETTRMSSKGQIVIPQRIREELNATEGTLFAVVGGRDTVVLKKVETPSKDAIIRDLELIAKEGRKRLEMKGFKEADIPELVQKLRRK